MANKAFDRSQEDFGNVLNMEHINLTVPDQQVAALFYVTGLRSAPRRSSAATSGWLSRISRT